MIPRACVLNQQNENILSCKSGSDANNLNGKAVLGSLTQKERKRLIDRRYRANVKVQKHLNFFICIFFIVCTFSLNKFYNTVSTAQAKTQKVLDDFESVSKENVELKEQLLLLKNNGQLNVPSKRVCVTPYINGLVQIYRSSRVLYKHCTILTLALVFFFPFAKFPN